MNERHLSHRIWYCDWLMFWVVMVFWFLDLKLIDRNHFLISDL